MASLDELRRAIREARAELLRAADPAAATWDQPRGPESSGEEGWSPRQAAEHAISADTAFARAVADAVGLEPPPRPTVVLPTLDVAVTVGADVAKLADGVYEALESTHLEMETRFAGNVEGVLRLAAEHLKEHARQIAGDG